MANMVDSRPPDKGSATALLCVVLALGLGIYWLFQQIKWQQINTASSLFWQHNWGWIVGIPLVVTITITMHKWVPQVWRGYKAFHTHRHDHLDRVAYREFLSKATQKLEEGYNTKFVNSKTGDVIEISNPYISQRATTKISEEQVPQLLPAKEQKGPRQALPIPEKYDLNDVFRRHEIGPERIFLGYAEGNEPIFIDSGDLCHGVFVADTGKGKTVIERGIISQLLHVEHQVVLADLKFALFTESGIDYKPLAKKMLLQPPLMIEGQAFPSILRKEERIAQLLHWLAYPEMKRRLDMRANGDFSYTTLDVFVEELLALILAYPECADDIQRIIALGRELRLNLFTAAQNFLAKTTNMPGAARENFQTAYFLGGDERSGAFMLDMKQKELGDFLRFNNIILGKSVGMLRNNINVPEARLVRLGMSSNDAIYYHHGRADSLTMDDIDNWTPDRFRASQSRTFGSESYRQRTEPLVRSHQLFQTSPLREQRANFDPRRTVSGSLTTPVSEPDKPSEGNREPHVPSEAKVVVTEREKAVILAAAHTQLQQTKKPLAKGCVNRTKLIEALNKMDSSWNNKAWDKVKQVLDEKGW